MKADACDYLGGVAHQWRAWARMLMHEVEQARQLADTVRLATMAATLEWAASELLWVARNPPLAGLGPPQLQPARFPE